MDHTTRFYGLRSTNPKNFGIKRAAMRLHAPSEWSPQRTCTAAFFHVLTRVGRLTHARKCQMVAPDSHVLHMQRDTRVQISDVIRDVILHGSDPFVQIWLGPTRKFDLDPNPLKKKKFNSIKLKKKKMLWPNGPLTMTKKLKISKRTCPTQFFEYIPILGPISSFEARKLCKCPISKKVDFCGNVDQTSKFLIWTYLVQFFVYILILEFVPSFETQKLHKWLKFQDSWLLCWDQPKVKIFKPHLSCSIFRVHSEFEVYFLIWESKIAQIVWFYNCWL